MIESQALFSQFRQEQLSQDCFSISQDPNELSYTDSDKFEDFDEDDDYMEYIYEEDEEEYEDLEEEEFIWIHNPMNTTKRFDPKKQKIKAEKARERNEKLQAQKRARKLLHFIPESDQDSVSFLKRSNKFLRTRDTVRHLCSIPERNLLLIILIDGKTVHVYSTTNFKLILRKHLQKEVTTISFSKDLNKILIGGLNHLVQILNPMTLEVEVETSPWPFYAYYFQRHLQNIPRITHTIEYIPKFNIIVTAMKFTVSLTHIQSTVSIYDTNLDLIQQFSPPAHLGHWEPCPSEIFALSRERLLIPCRYEKRKILVLLNLKTHSQRAYPELYIPDSSSIEMTEDDHLKTFTFLMSFKIERPSEFYIVPFPFKLTQITFNCKTEELVISKKTASPHEFTLFRRIEGSKFFLAQEQISFDESRKVLLSINKEKIEIVKVILESWRELGRCLVMVRDGFSMVEINNLDRIVVHGKLFMKGEKKKILVEESKIKNDDTNK